MEKLKYEPLPKPQPVVKAGEFVFSAIGLDHGHIKGMCEGLISAGATLKWIYDKDIEKAEEYLAKFPTAQIAQSEEQVLADPKVQLVASAIVTSERCALGLRVMESGKDYFVDKAPMTTLEQLEEAKAAVAKTGKKYAIYFSERIHKESGVFAGQLLKSGAIGKVIQVMGTGPHRLNVGARPSWFFEKEKYGGIICDIGSHQVEQFLFFSGATDAKVQSSQVGNYNHPQYPELEDFGDAMLLGNNGATNYFRVNWFTTKGTVLSGGDSSMFILGTDGCIEMKRTPNIKLGKFEEHLTLIGSESEHSFVMNGQVGFPFFGELILDCINRTENAMTQNHAFKAAELCLKAQLDAVRTI